MPRQAALIVSAMALLTMCAIAEPARAQTRSLLWTGDGRSNNIGGYRVAIDGVTTDHGTSPLRSDGTCGCSVPLALNGGRHTIVVTAYNASGQTPSAPFVVAPIANPGGPYAGQSGVAIAVSGAASLAPTGTLTNYTWRWGDGSADTTSSLSSASHVFSTSGTFTVTLTVRDNAGATAAASTTATISGTLGLPAPWQTQDVGAVGLSGSASYLNGQFTVAGAGADNTYAADAFRYVYRSLSGDGQLVARVAGLQNTHASARAGVMIRESLALNARLALIDARPNGSVELVARTATGGTTAQVAVATQAVPAWLKLARSGNTLVASVSANGSSWSVVGTANVTMGADVLVGLAVTSWNVGALNTSVFDNVTLTTGSATQPPATPTSPTPTSGATGVSTAASLTWSAIGATSYDVSFGTSNPPPAVASALTAATYRPPSMNAGTTYYWSVLARNSAGTRSGPVWSFTTAPPQTGGSVPSPWAHQDIGAVGRSGNATYSSGTFTVTGSGADIWGTADAFHFVHQPLNANTEIVARVVSLQNTNTYAKAGVMIRAGLDAGAAHVLLNVRPGGQIEFLRRQGQGLATNSIGGASQSPPAWLKLVRAGSIVTGYVSANGSTWTQVGSTSVTLGASPYVGLAVTSHNTSLLNTASIDSVTLRAGAPPPPPPTSTGDVVIYASDVAASARHGSWQTAADSLSPNGVKLTTPNNGIVHANAPLAAPLDYIDVTFMADTGRPYRIWLRLRATNNLKANDAVWVQFSDSLVNGSPVYRMNTTSGLLVNLATTASANSLQNWGWQNGAYWLSQPTTVTFATSGMHTMRIQVREDGVQLDQIVLSPERYLDTAPGWVSGDSTIVPKQ